MRAGELTFINPFQTINARHIDIDVYVLISYRQSLSCDYAHAGIIDAHMPRTKCAFQSQPFICVNKPKHTMAVCR